MWPSYWSSTFFDKFYRFINKWLKIDKWFSNSKTWNWDLSFNLLHKRQYEVHTSFSLLQLPTKHPLENPKEGSCNLYLDVIHNFTMSCCGCSIFHGCRCCCFSRGAVWIYYWFSLITSFRGGAYCFCCWYTISCTIARYFECIRGTNIFSCCWYSSSCSSGYICSWFIWGS